MRKIELNFCALLRKPELKQNTYLMFNFNSKLIDTQNSYTSVRNSWTNVWFKRIRTIQNCLCDCNNNFLANPHFILQIPLKWSVQGAHTRIYPKIFIKSQRQITCGSNFYVSDVIDCLTITNLPKSQMMSHKNTSLRDYIKWLCLWLIHLPTNVKLISLDEFVTVKHPCLLEAPHLF